MSFEYRECKIQIERDTFNKQNIYAAWVNYATGCAIAVPYAANPTEAIIKSKQWIDKRLDVT